MQKKLIKQIHTERTVRLKVLITVLKVNISKVIKSSINLYL